MGLGMLKAIRVMTGSKRYIVDISGYDRVGDANNDARYVATREAIHRDFKDFELPYVNNRKKFMNSLESVLHWTILHDFNSVVEFEEVTIKYRDVTVHIRLILDGIDEKLENGTILTSGEFKTMYLNEELELYYNRISVGEEEYWQYIIKCDGGNNV